MTDALHAVVDQLPDAITAYTAVRDASGDAVGFVATYRNEAAAGLDLTPDDANGLRSAFAHVIATGEPYAHAALWHGGAVFEVHASRADDGVVAVYRDITEDVIVSELRELALAEQRSLTRQLRDLDDSRSALIAAVTHDLRTPLTGIVGLGWLLDSDWEAMDEVTRRDYVRDIVRSGEELDRRITSVLEHLKVESGRFEVELEPCDVGEELAGAIDRMTLMLEPYQIVFAVPDDTVVRADRMAFARVVENLLSNAVKYAPAASTVTLRAAREGDTVVVSVEDEGPGVSAEDALRVFQQFERLESGRRVAYGNGVGLAAVRQLVELMGGRVWVEPNQPRGSAFRFALSSVA